MNSRRKQMSEMSSWRACSASKTGQANMAQFAFVCCRAMLLRYHCGTPGRLKFVYPVQRYGSISTTVSVSLAHSRGGPVKIQHLATACYLESSERLERCEYLPRSEEVCSNGFIGLSSHLCRWITFASNGLS